MDNKVDFGSLMVKVSVYKDILSNTVEYRKNGQSYLSQ